jgi:hypothetical protein
MQMKRTIKSILFCVFLGSIPSFLSILLVVGTENTSPYWYQKLLYWNVFLASQLASAGILPYCPNCELLTLLEILLYGFVIGAIGYSAVIFTALRLNASRHKKRLP